jgi:hypothetical protein
MYACGSGGGSGSEGGVGSISFDLALATSEGSGVVAGQQLNQAEFPCEDNGVETIDAQVLDQNDELIAEGGPFDCTAGEGSLTSVPVGTNHLLVVSAKNSEDVITFSGEVTVSVREGVTTDVGIITLNVFNQPPELDPIGDKSGTEGVLLSFNISAKDPNLGDVLKFEAGLDGVLGTLPEDAELVDNGDRTAVFNWTPSLGAAGQYDILFQVTDNGEGLKSDSESITITIADVNQPPVAVDDTFNDIQAFSLDNVLDVLDNDIDPEDHPLIITDVDSPSVQGGSVAINNAGDRLLYTPAPGFFGRDTFTYTITDVPGGAFTPLTDTSRVTVNVTATITRVSVATDGGDANGNSFNPAVSANGLIVAFESTANNLVDGDNNGESDIFIHNRQTGTTERVSVPDSGGEASGSSENPSISADGLVVAFDSTATDLVSNDGNFASDIFVRDRSADPPSTVRISVDENGFDANGGSFNPSVSADGLIVAFESTASDLVSGDGNFDRDIFVRDRSSVPESTVRVSVDIADGDANGGSFTPSISADGRFVAFVSLAENLVGTDDTNGFADVFVRDLDAGTTRLVSIASDGTQGNGHSGGIILRVFNPVRVSISSDGRFVVFGSDATNLLDVADTNGIFDIFLHDRDANANGIFDEPGFISTVRVSVTSDGIEANNASSNPSIDSSGRFVAFDSSASNLVSDDGNIFSDVFEAPNFLAP